MDREEQIRARAHSIWEQEGQPESRSSEHWERAEREIDADAAEQGGNEETGAALASTAQADALAPDDEISTGSSDDKLLQEGPEGSAQLHEDVTGSPQGKPLGKRNSASKKR